jgi:ADP-heptose:LPS heptosyltransferase/lauroyl/myristoyl acyltransferase
LVYWLKAHRFPMLTLLFKTFGWLLARAPEPLLRGLTAVLGEALLWLAPRRRRVVLSNLHHAFPDRPAEWHRRMARTCFRRLIETGLLSLATPFLSEKRIRAIARFAPSVDAWVPEIGRRPFVLATLHLALWETQTWFPLLCPVPIPEFGIIFRPLDNRSADSYLKRTRERFGLRLLSRKEGFAEALHILRSNGCVGVLFDQNAGLQGALTTLFGRVCSTTELPGLLATRFGAEVRTFYPRRTAFWRVSFESERIAHDGTVAGVTFALNRWLEAALCDDALCASWLWGHDRWRHQDMPRRRFRLDSKRDLLAADLAARGLGALPRKTRIWVRLPNWLGDATMAVPLLRALRAGRPDAEINLLAREAFLPLLAGWGVADRLHALPPRGARYFLHFWALRREYPDVWILLTNSARGDLEAWFSRCPQRFGIIRPNRPRPLLTSAYHRPRSFGEPLHHQLKLWEYFFRHFGLTAPPDRTPLPFAGRPVDPGLPKIGLISGSENEPEKRWPVSHWLRLIASLPGHRFVLFGTAGDQPIAAAIEAGAPPGAIENLAGRTDLPTLAARLGGCRLVVSNDCGGMHLANAVGTPVIGLFGPTNPVRTAPVFSAPWAILQPPGCPPTGGAALAGLQPESVAASVRSLAREKPGAP